MVATEKLIFVCLLVMASLAAAETGSVTGTMVTTAKALCHRAATAQPTTRGIMLSTDGTTTTQARPTSNVPPFRTSNVPPSRLQTPPRRERALAASNGTSNAPPPHFKRTPRRTAAHSQASESRRMSHTKTKSQSHHPRDSSGKRSYYWDVCSHWINGRERLYVCKKQIR
uniref:Secreted protein n=1 Tax=Macrostomum lignano TaxID=282301 RepID=A0A1I8IZF9_9PLAT